MPSIPISNKLHPKVAVQYFVSSETTNQLAHFNFSVEEYNGDIFE